MFREDLHQRREATLAQLRGHVVELEYSCTDSILSELELVYADGRRVHVEAIVVSVERDYGVAQVSQLIVGGA